MAFLCDNSDDIQVVVDSGILSLPSFLGTDSACQRKLSASIYLTWLFINKNFTDYFVWGQLGNVQAAARSQGGHGEEGSLADRVTVEDTASQIEQPNTSHRSPG